MDTKRKKFIEQAVKRVAPLWKKLYQKNANNTLPQKNATTDPERTALLDKVTKEIDSDFKKLAKKDK